MTAIYWRPSPARQTQDAAPALNDIQPGASSAFVIRHGTFASRDEAEAKRKELTQLDLPANQVVPVR